MNKIELNNLGIQKLTEQDILDYCLINNIKPDKILILDLSSNKLTDISVIKLFKNLENLNISFNKIKDISVLKDLNKLEYLNISDNNITDISVLKDLNNIINLDIFNLKLESDQIQYINSLNNLRILYQDCFPEYLLKYYKK